MSNAQCNSINRGIRIRVRIGVVVCVRLVRIRIIRIIIGDVDHPVFNSRISPSVRLHARVIHNTLIIYIYKYAYPH